MPTARDNADQPLLNKVPAPLDAGIAVGGIGAANEVVARLKDLLAKKNQRETPARRKSNELLRKSLRAHAKENMREAALLALDATKIDPTSGQAFHMLAIALEKLGELSKAFHMYEKAFQIDPTDPELYLNLGLAAWKLKMLDGAEKFFRVYIDMRPDSSSGYNNLAAVLRDKGQFEEAITTLQAAIARLPDQPNLWNTVGTVLAERGDFDQAETFYREALRLEPKFGRALHNIGFARSHQGDLEEAARYYEAALPQAESEHDRLEINHALAMCWVGLGDLKRGWPLYETRLHPRFRSSLLYGLRAPKWTGEDLTGKTMLLVGEQGLGDEIMFASVIPDLLERLGPTGKLLIASDKRLSPLFARSFAGTTCGNHIDRRHNGKGLRLVPWATGNLAPDVFAPFGSALPFLRTNLEAFRLDRGFLVPDTARVASFRERIAALGPGLALGVCWRSMMLTTERQKYYGALSYWAKALKQDGLKLINLQYGDCAAELKEARERYGLEIHHFEDLDLKNDLDGAAALSAACDLMVSAPTAAAALSAAVGTDTWFLVAGSVWPQLGTDHYPWYPRTRVISPKIFGDWDDAMAKLRAALAARLDAAAAA
ncbi:MAG: tetratricopeptide repeat protein [Alphaproteobacteria bacterium]|nr:tetratricopeptide repeat protein [Alphaproteobacteria bacterium]